MLEVRLEAMREASLMMISIIVLLLLVVLLVVVVVEVVVVVVYDWRSAVGATQARAQDDRA